MLTAQRAKSRQLETVVIELRYSKENTAGRQD